MIETIDKKKDTGVYYYMVQVSYEIPYDVLDSEDEDIRQAREILYSRLSNSIPEKYEKFSVRLSLSQLKDNLNYLVTYTAFFKCPDGLPMEEYVEARDIQKSVEKELEEFFKSIDCEYQKLNIKSFN